jgi:hypothetical protein
LHHVAEYLWRAAASLYSEGHRITPAWPIGSGIVEGACRHRVKDRVAVTGARRGLAGADAILMLRALKINGDFDH